MSDVTRIHDSSGHDQSFSNEEYVLILYEGLRRLAASMMTRERPGQTLQATALVHEAYLRLGGSEQQPWENRRHFLSAAAEAMRRVLVENARRKKRLKHGGELKRVELDHVELPVEVPSDELLAIDETLERLARVDSQAAQLVKLRYFVGLTQAQVAEILGVSRRTANNMWAFARAWLYRALRSDPSSGSKHS